MRTLRFGIGIGGRPGSRYWALKAAAGRPEVYLRGNRTGAFFGVSLHQDPNHWHWKISRPDSKPQYLRWPRPAPLAPGLTRAIEVIAHADVARRGPPIERRNSIVWYTPGRRGRVHFDIFVEEPGTNLKGWPGKRHGTRLVGRVSLSDGSTAAVVASESEHEEQTWNLPAPASDVLSKLRDATRTGNHWVVLMGVSDEGTAWMIDAPVEPMDSLD